SVAALNNASELRAAIEPLLIERPVPSAGTSYRPLTTSPRTPLQAGRVRQAGRRAEVLLAPYSQTVEGQSGCQVRDQRSAGQSDWSSVLTSTHPSGTREAH